MFGDWYGRQSEKVQAAVDVALEYLEQREQEEWGLPDFKMLSGAQAKVGEVRFKVEKKQYRLLGCFGPGKKEFTLLAGCSKKGQVYDPRNALDTAVERMDAVMADGSRSRVRNSKP